MARHPRPSKHSSSGRNPKKSMADYLYIHAILEEPPINTMIKPLNGVLTNINIYSLPALLKYTYGFTKHCINPLATLTLVSLDTGQLNLLNIIIILVPYLTN